MRQKVYSKGKEMHNEMRHLNNKSPSYRDADIGLYSEFADRQTERKALAYTRCVRVSGKYDKLRYVTSLQYHEKM